MTDLFDSAWLKWGWAVRHSERFLADIKRIAEDPNVQPRITVRAEYQPKRHAFAVVVTDLTPPTPVYWGLMLGDVAVNYRAALDHLAWATIKRGKTPPATLPEGRRKRIMFPIEPNREGFRKSARTHLPGIRRADLAIIRRYQPHGRRPSNPKWHCLTILRRLNDFDKHRELHPVFMLPTNVRYQIGQYRDCVKSRPIRRRGQPLPLEIDTELGILPVRRTGPNPRVDVQVDLSTLVGLDNGMALVTWFDNTRDWIAAILSKFSKPPRRLLAEIARA